MANRASKFESQPLNYIDQQLRRQATVDFYVVDVVPIWYPQYMLQAMLVEDAEEAIIFKVMLA